MSSAQIDLFNQYDNQTLDKNSLELSFNQLFDNSNNNINISNESSDSNKIKTEIINIISSSKIAFNNKIKDLEEKNAKLNEENKKMKQQLFYVTQKLIDCSKYIIKQKKEIQSLKDNKNLFYNENTELKFSFEHQNSQNSINDDSLTINNYKNYSENDLTFFSRMRSSDQLSFRKSKSNKLAYQLMFYKNGTKTDSFHSNSEQIKSEENKQIMKEKFFSHPKLLKLKKKYDLPENISLKDIKQALIDNNFDEDKAVDCLLKKK